MIDLYGMGSPNVVKVILALEELEFPWRLHFVDVFMGEQFSDAFGALTPNRKVPVIVDPNGPDGSPITLWESAAILNYLAEKSGRLMPSEPRARHIIMQWLMFQVGGIGPMFGQQSHFRLYNKDPVNDYSRARYGTEVLRLYDVLEARLNETPWLGGDVYSIADIAAWPWVRSMKVRGAEPDKLPQVTRWVEEISARPAAHRTLAALDAMKQFDPDQFARDHPDKLDRYLGRGRYSRVQI